jgi:hypothetical protein
MIGPVLIVAFWALLIWLWGRWDLFAPRNLDDYDIDIYRQEN